MVRKKVCKNCAFYCLKTQKCSNNKFVYTGEGASMDNDGLGYWDCESYSASFETGENFGCIHFKKR